MHKLSLFVATVLVMLGGRSLNAQHPLFNLGGKAWRVRYNVDDEVKTDRGYDAIQLILRPGLAPGTISGLLYVYEGFEDVSGTDRYKEREFGGVIPIAGRITTTANGGNRKRVAFIAGGTYDGEGGAEITVRVEGYVHVGERGAAAQRDDDRVCFRLVERPSLQVALLQKLVLKELDLKTLSDDECKKLLLKLAALIFEPCDDDADEDLLEEETLEDDPPPEYEP